jgi:hypothetical protein
MTLRPDGFERPIEHEAQAHCPYCGEPARLLLHADGADTEEYVEDCPVCCNPWQVVIRHRVDAPPEVRLRTLDE